MAEKKLLLTSRLKENAWSKEFEPPIYNLWKNKRGACKKKRGKTKRYSLDYFKIFGKKK